MISQECRAFAKVSTYLVVWKYIMDVKCSYQVFKLWFMWILFFNCPSYSNRSLFGVLCHLETSVFGTSEDNTESNLQWVLDFTPWPSERVHGKVCGRKSSATLGDGEWETHRIVNIHAKRKKHIWQPYIWMNPEFWISDTSVSLDSTLSNLITCTQAMVV